MIDKLKIRHAELKLQRASEVYEKKKNAWLCKRGDGVGQTDNLGIIADRAYDLYIVAKTELQALKNRDL